MRQDDKHTFIDVTITEGKNRQIHRMLDAQVIEQADTVVRRVPEAEGLAVPVRAAHRS